MAKIIDNSSAFEDLINERVNRFLIDSATVVLRRAKENCRRRSGELARSIFMWIQGNTARIGSNLPQAIVMELGSRPHIIRPNQKVALWWVGLDHPVKKVNHPGVKAVPFLRPALETSRKDIEDIAKREKIL
jgi:phage gpG-like protein